MSDTVVTQRRRLGKAGPEVSAIGLGCMSLSGVYGTSDDAAGIALIHRAIDLGVDHFDSSDMYGWGQNEELLGRALRGWHDGVVIASKFGQTRRPGGANGVDGSPAYIAQACEASLKRLGVDTIDLYYQHRVDPQTPIEDTIRAMAQLVREGKVRFLGLSEASPATIRRADAVHPIAALQTEYSLWTRDPEDGVLQTTRELGIAFIAYSPLGRGFLTGQIKRFDDLAADDYRRTSPRFQGENFQKNLDLVARVESIAREKNCTPGQLALAWLLAQGGDIIPIPGTKRRKYLEENVRALNVTVTPQDLRRIEEVAPKGVASGQRYPATMMQLVNG